MGLRGARLGDSGRESWRVLSREGLVLRGELPGEREEETSAVGLALCGVDVD